MKKQNFFLKNSIFYFAIFIFSVGFFYILNFLVTHKSNFYATYILGSAMLVTMWGGIVVNKKQFLISFFLLFLLFIIPAFLFYFFNTPDYKRFARLLFAYVVFTIDILVFISILRYAILKKSLLFIVLSILAIPSLAYLCYYTFMGIELNGEAVAAVLETNFNEANEYFFTQLKFSTFLVIVGLFLAVYIIYKFAKNLKIEFSKTSVILSYILIAFNMIAIKNVEKFDSPYHTKYIDSYFKTYERYEKNRQSRLNSIKNLKANQDGVFVLVIGESQNKNYMSVYGYDKNTTPFLNKLIEDKNVIFFSQAHSNHTHTSPVLTYALSAKNQYNNKKVENSPSIIELANLSGFNTIWLSNQVEFGLWGSPVSAITMATKNRTFTSKDDGVEKFDEVLFPLIDNLKINDKTFLVIHLMGNHGSYAQRYPKKFQKFGDKKSEQHYENSMLYNDFVINEIYKRVKNIPNFKALVYLADHADDINLGHDSKRFVYQMSQIPFFIYFSDEYKSANSQIFYTLKSHKDDFWTNDLLFNLMSSLMGISSNLDEPKNDITNKAYDNNKSRFKTLHNKKTLIDEIKKSN